MGDTIKVENFLPADKKEVLDLLSEAGLPIDDLTDEKMKNFMIARDSDGSIIGVVGIEMYGDSGLLRSLAVSSAYRRKGLGRLLTHKIESFARQNGIKALYLLTMTAADYFPEIGYQATPRDKLPAPIKKTDEFKNLCPVSAKCLFKVLASA
jgi:amino-acid N-acetyltransferase